MTRILFVLLVAVILFRWAENWRRVIGVTLIAALTAGVIFPAPAFAQSGLLGGIEEILDIINGEIGDALNMLESVSRSLQVLYEEIVWPARLIDQAKTTVASLIARFRGTMQSIYRTRINSATLPDPI